MHQSILSLALWLGLGDRDLDRSAVKFLAVKLVDGFLVVCLVGELHEAKTTGAAGISFVDNSGAGHFADLLKELLETVVSRRKSEAADK